MSAIAHPVPVLSPAQHWFNQHLPEITSRCKAVFARLPATEAEEAIADTLAVIYQNVLRAQRRGNLHRITPFWLVSFAARQYRAGRRFNGASATDVMGERTRILGRVKVISLDDNQYMIPDPSGQVEPVESSITEAFAAMNREDQPLDNLRRKHDYPFIVKKERLSRKAKRILKVISQDWTPGVGTRLAYELRATPARITQIKSQIGAALQRNGYGPPPKLRAKSTAS